MEPGKTININQCVDLYGDLLYRYTLVRVRNAEEAADIVQSTFLAALQSKHDYVGRSTEKNWLFGILKHKILDYFREIKKRQTFDLLPEDDRDCYEHSYDKTGRWIQPPISWTMNPESVAENKQLAEVMAKCMDGMSSKYRQVFVLKEIEGMKSEEICKEFAIQPNNLWIILHRARNQLKKCLEINWFKKP